MTSLLIFSRVVSSSGIGISELNHFSLSFVVIVSFLGFSLTTCHVWHMSSSPPATLRIVFIILNILHVILTLATPRSLPCMVAIVHENSSPSHLLTNRALFLFSQALLVITFVFTIQYIACAVLFMNRRISTLLFRLWRFAGSLSSLLSRLRYLLKFFLVKKSSSSPLLTSLCLDVYLHHQL